MATGEELNKEIGHWLAHDRQSSRFDETPIYQPDDDSLICFIRDEKCYRKRLNGLLTLYLSSANHELVGCKIKGVKRIRRMMEVLDIREITAEDDSKFNIYLSFAVAPLLEEESEMSQVRSGLSRFNRIRVKKGTFAKTE